MFIFTAKFNKKKAILIVLLLGILLCAIILFASRHSSTAETAALSAVVKNNDQRVEYLESLGWKIESEPIEEQTVIIPKTFPDVYANYNELQIQQGFDLSEYAGMEATRYTYKVLNYPNEKNMVVADILVYRNEVIAGNIQSVALDGFMTGLKKTV